MKESNDLTPTKEDSKVSSTPQNNEGLKPEGVVLPLNPPKSVYLIFPN